MSNSLLMSPITIGKTTFKNRVIMSPMCMYSSVDQDGRLGKLRFDHYTTRAAGGVGGIVVEATMVLPNTGISKFDLGLYNDQQEADFAELVKSVKFYGAAIGIQLGHGGRKAQGYTPIYSSSNQPFSDDYEVPEVMTKEQLQELVDAFISSAQRAERAGFDFVEIHCAHGYLLNQFITPLVNDRTDEFGGSLENRFRLIRSIVQGVKSATNLDIHMRFSANEIEEGGNSLEDIKQMMTWAKEDGVVLFDISSGGITTTPPNIYPGYQATISRQLSQAGFTVGAVGLLGDPDLCEYILRSNDAQLIYLGRPLLRNPYWVYEAAIKLHDKSVTYPLHASYSRGFM